jgi:membrane associated rhomboid family serine protease
MRMRGAGGGGFGGGGMAGLESTSAKLALGLVAGSVLWLLTRGGGGNLLLLDPAGVFLGLRLWQPFTYAFIQTSPIGIIFGAIIIWSIGTSLESSWGPKRLLMVTVGVTVLAGFLTALLAFVIPLPRGYPGGTVLTSVLWVAYGLAIGRGQANFWGIPLSGNALAGIGAGFVLLQALTAGWASTVPELFGLVLVYAYVKGASPRRAWLHLQHWRLQRQVRNRSKHLHVVSGERRPADSDRYLN